MTEKCLYDEREHGKNLTQLLRIQEQSHYEPLKTLLPADVPREGKEKRMILTSEQFKNFKEKARPLIKWLNENCHPHVCVIVTQTGAQLMEDVAYCFVKDYIKD